MMRIALFACLISLFPARPFAQQTPTPEQAGASVAETMRKLTSKSPGKMIEESLGSYHQMVQERLKRDLNRPSSPPPDLGGGSRFNLGRNNSNDPLYRQSLYFNTDSVDVPLLRLSPRITAGVGVAERSMTDHGVTMYDGYDKYGFIKFQIGGRKDEKKSRLIMPPTSTYTETELGPSKVRVDREEFTRGLKDLQP